MSLKVWKESGEGGGVGLIEWIVVDVLFEGE
jgi:hypothetical protein